MVSSRKAAWLYDGVTMVIDGSKREVRSDSVTTVSSVQGQPVLPSGGGGSSKTPGQRIGLQPLRAQRRQTARWSRGRNEAVVVTIKLQ